MFLMKTEEWKIVWKFLALFCLNNNNNNLHFQDDDNSTEELEEDEDKLFCPMPIQVPISP